MSLDDRAGLCVNSAVLVIPLIQGYIELLECIRPQCERVRDAKFPDAHFSLTYIRCGHRLDLAQMVVRDCGLRAIRDQLVQAGYRVDVGDRELTFTHERLPGAIVGASTNPGLLTELGRRFENDYRALLSDTCSVVTLGDPEVVRMLAVVASDGEAGTRVSGVTTSVAQSVPIVEVAAAAPPAASGRAAPDVQLWHPAHAPTVDSGNARSGARSADCADCDCSDTASVASYSSLASKGPTSVKKALQPAPRSRSKSPVQGSSAAPNAKLAPTKKQACGGGGGSGSGSGSGTGSRGASSCSPTSSVASVTSSSLPRSAVCTPNAAACDAPSVDDGWTCVREPPKAARKHESSMASAFAVLDGQARTGTTSSCRRAWCAFGDQCSKSRSECGFWHPGDDQEHLETETARCAAQVLLDARALTRRCKADDKLSDRIEREMAAMDNASDFANPLPCKPAHACRHSWVCSVTTCPRWHPRQRWTEMLRDAGGRSPFSFLECMALDLVIRAKDDRVKRAVAAAMSILRNKHAQV